MINNKNYKGFQKKAFVIDSDSRMIKKLDVLDIKDGMIELVDSILPEDEAEIFYDIEEDSLVYCFNLDSLGTIESQRLKDLRRNVVLSRMFDYKVDKPFDLVKFMPWLIIIALIIFK